MNKNFITTKDLAEILKVTTQTIWRWRKEGMPFHEIGSNIGFELEEVEEWIETNKSITIGQSITELKSMVNNLVPSMIIGLQPLIDHYLITKAICEKLEDHKQIVDILTDNGEVKKDDLIPRNIRIDSEIHRTELERLENQGTKDLYELHKELVYEYRKGEGKRSNVIMHERVQQLSRLLIDEDYGTFAEKVMNKRL